MVLSHEEMFTTLKSNFFSGCTTVKASFARVSQNNRKTDLADFARLGPIWLSTHAPCF